MFDSEIPLLPADQPEPLQGLTVPLLPTLYVGDRVMQFIRDVMTRDVRVENPDDTIQHAASRMMELDTGVLPVGEDDRLVGMITDRDIAVRAVAKGRGCETKVRDVMSPEIKYCYDDEPVTHVAENMAELQVRRLPVVNRDKRLVGIVALGDLAHEAEPEAAADSLRGISKPGGKHSQSP